MKIRSLQEAQEMNSKVGGLEVTSSAWARVVLSGRAALRAVMGSGPDIKVLWLRQEMSKAH